MNPYGFWGTLDMFVGHENKRTGKDVLDDVGNWLSTLATDGAPDGNYRLSAQSHDDTTGYGGSDTSVQRTLSSNRLLDLDDFNNKLKIVDKKVDQTKGSKNARKKKVA